MRGLKSPHYWYFCYESASKSALYRIMEYDKPVFSSMNNANITLKNYKPCALRDPKRKDILSEESVLI